MGGLLPTSTGEFTGFLNHQNRLGPKRKIHLPTIHFQGFRGEVGSASLPFYFTNMLYKWLSWPAKSKNTLTHNKRHTGDQRFLHLKLYSIKNWMGPYQRTPKEVARAIRFSGLGVRSVGSCWRFLWYIPFTQTHSPMKVDQGLLAKCCDSFPTVNQWGV